MVTNLCKCGHSENNHEPKCRGVAPYEDDRVCKCPAFDFDMTLEQWDKEHGNNVCFECGRPF